MTTATLPAEQAAPPIARPHIAGRVAVAVAPPLVTALVVVALGWPTLILPFWSDTAIFALIGQTIADGGAPYVDAWDQKPPAIYLLYALALQLPWDLVTNVRAFDLAWCAATSAATVVLGRRWWGVRAGIAAGLTYGVVYVTASGWWQLAQPDGFIGLPFALALLLQAPGRGRTARMIAAGALLGFAFQLRAIAALLIPAMPLVAALEAPRGRRFVSYVRDLLLLGAGFLLCQSAFAAYLASVGALDDYIAATRFAAGYTNLGGPWQGERGPTTEEYLQAIRLSLPLWALNRPVLTIPAAAGAIAGAFLLRDRRALQLTIMVLLGYAGIAFQAKFFWYHYLLVFPFLALLAGYAWDRLLAALHRSQPRPVAYLLAVALAALLISSTTDVADGGWKQWSAYIEWQERPAKRPEFLSIFPGYDASRRAADHLRYRTDPDDAVQIWGYDPVLYLLAERPSASRFIYALPLMSDWAPRDWQAGFMEEMEANRPAYFVAQRGQGGPWIVGHAVDPADFIPWFPELQTWLTQNYVREGEWEGYVYYRRRDHQGGPHASP